MRAGQSRSAALRSRARKIQLAVFDFDGVFTDNLVIVFQDGREAVVCSRADGFGLSMLRATGCQLLVVSTETNPVVQARCRKLGIDVVQACEDKVAAVKAAVTRLKLQMSNVAFLGNDINDLACLNVVGLPACVADAYPEVKRVAAFRTRALGGRGAVREFCEFIVAAKKRSATASGRGA